jgi:hypothetical protein
MTKNVPELLGRSKEAISHRFKLLKKKNDPRTVPPPPAKKTNHLLAFLDQSNKKAKRAPRLPQRAGPKPAPKQVQPKIDSMFFNKK